MGELTAGDDGAESQAPHRRSDRWERRAIAPSVRSTRRAQGLLENWSCGWLVVPGSRVGFSGGWELNSVKVWPWSCSGSSNEMSWKRGMSRESGGIERDRAASKAGNRTRTMGEVDERRESRLEPMEGRRDGGRLPLPLVAQGGAGGWWRPLLHAASECSVVLVWTYPKYQRHHPSVAPSLLGVWSALRQADESVDSELLAAHRGPEANERARRLDHHEVLNSSGTRQQYGVAASQPTNHPANCPLTQSTPKLLFLRLPTRWQTRHDEQRWQTCHKSRLPHCICQLRTVGGIVLLAFTRWRAWPFGRADATMHGVSIRGCRCRRASPSPRADPVGLCSTAQRRPRLG